MSNTNTQNRNKNESKMLFLERAQWKKGEVAFTVLVETETKEQMPVAYVFLHDYDENRKPILVSFDVAGMEIMPKANNAYQLKRDFRSREEELTKKTNEYELSERNESITDQTDKNTEGKNPDTTPEPQQEIKKVRSRKSTKSKQQEISL